jgi:hypothetical protein
MSKYVALDGATIEPDESGTTASFQVVTPASSVLFSSGLGAMVGEQALLISGATDGTYTQTAPTFPATIEPSGENTSEGLAIVLDGDDGPTVSIPGTDESGASGDISVTPIITDPNNTLLLSI